MKTLIKPIALSCLLVASTIALFASPSFAGGECSANSRHIIEISPYPDANNTMFISVDAPSNCGCSVSQRFGWYASDPNAKNFLALALTAFAQEKQSL